jgi:hypothetical protein
LPPLLEPKKKKNPSAPPIPSARRAGSTATRAASLRAFLRVRPKTARVTCASSCPSSRNAPGRARSSTTTPPRRTPPS